MRKFLSDPVWQGIGVFVAIIAIFATFNYSSCSKKIITNTPKEEIIVSDTIDLNKIRDSITKVEKTNAEIEKQKLFLEMTDRVLSNLDKTEYNEEDFDYWPSGGMRNIYSHAKSLVTYEMFLNTLPTSLYVSGPHTNKVLFLNSQNDFGHYNPETIKWIDEKITIYLNKDGNISRTKPLVDQYLKKQLTTYWLCYQYMRAYPSENTFLLTDYKEKINAGNLPDRYYYSIVWEGAEKFNFYKEISKYEFIDVNILCSAIYFWLRRQIDSTDDKFYNILNTIMKSYYPTEVFHFQNYIP
ncbi:hypothetical protein [uncultured Chryseobacterium sp.]|uniref:hypothetical protein n=1 Tax=uncultured Chryseobacterium sp. TaxID=259322 RepID=UPI0025D74AF3|nr:hypothetical protein [uncultured Chryseobacterium sp.]